MRLDAVRLGDSFDFGKQGLITAFAIGTVADDGAKTGVFQFSQLVGKNLFGYRQSGRKVANVHK
ncbi:hypothetical protein D3C73_1318170 [compost metagenome]